MNMQFVCEFGIALHIFPYQCRTKCTPGIHIESHQIGCGSVFIVVFIFIFTFFAVFSLLFTSFFDIDLSSIWKWTLWPKRWTAHGNYWSSFCVSVILCFLAPIIIIIIIIGVRPVGWSLDLSLVRTHQLKLSWSTWRVTSINYFDKHCNFCVRFCSPSHFHLLV